jgi:hypothetical protein
MKRFVEGADRGQSTLFPECLEDWIGEDNPVRVIDVFVEELDLVVGGRLAWQLLGEDRPRQPVTGAAVDDPTGTFIVPCPHTVNGVVFVESFDGATCIVRSTSSLPSALHLVGCWAWRGPW